MPAKSKQQRLMAVVYAYLKDGKLPSDPEFAAKVKQIAHSISKQDARDFAKTTVKERITFKDFLINS